MGRRQAKDFGDSRSNPSFVKAEENIFVEHSSVGQSQRSFQKRGYQNIVQFANHKRSLWRRGHQTHFILISCAARK